MSITLSPNASAAKRKRLLVVILVATAATLISIGLLVTWLVIPRGQATIWIDDAKSWLSSEFKGPYTSAEELLILSSAFSMMASGIIEALLLMVPQDNSKRTKRWLRYTLITILSANANLAFVAFIYALANSGTPARGHTPDEQHIQNTLSPIKSVHNASHGKGIPCRRPVVSLWLSLLISVFSTILAVSTWQELREEDRDELEIPRVEKEPLSEKGPIFPDEMI
ncbi:hypothetical protein F5Y04DRAFT_283720 [Hypomontagnella monticulosa]|nr:hypothetical protein F5Y04DRAFT_283720 [Hypomontagnella monticulosa]